MICPSCITSAAVDEAYNPAPFDGIHHDDVVTTIVVARYIDASKTKRMTRIMTRVRVKERREKHKWPVGGQDALKTAHSSLANHLRASS